MHKAVHVPSATVVALKTIYVVEEAKRRQMKHELRMLHAFNTLPLTLEYDAGSPHREAQGDAGGGGRGVAAAGSYTRGPDGVENLLCMHDAYTDPDDGAVCLGFRNFNIRRTRSEIFVKFQKI